MANTETQENGLPGSEEQRSGAESELDVMRRELGELRDKNLRLIAEARNLSQRLQREKEESLRFAEADFARELLPVIDDLLRTQETIAAEDPGGKAADAVRISIEQFMKVLRAHRVEPIVAEGQPFDPAFHEAILQQPSDSVPAGHVLKEIHRGYRMHDRVLRTARVIVSSGTPAA